MILDGGIGKVKEQWQNHLLRSRLQFFPGDLAVTIGAES